MAHTLDLATYKPTLEEVLRSVADFRSTTRAIEINHARALIHVAKGALTWADAGETWARLCTAEPDTDYPAL